MADTRLIGVRKENKPLTSSQLIGINMSLLTWLIYYNDRTDIVYRPK